MNKNSAINSISDLRGKTFAFVDPDSHTGAIVPIFVLSKMNETPKTFFKKYIYSGGHDISIELVANGLVDGAAVDHLIWEYMNEKNPEFTSKTRIIAKHGPYCMPPIVTNPDTDAELKEKLRSILLEMDKDEKGKEILGRIKIEKFVVVNDSCYSSIREMITDLKNSKG